MSLSVACLFITSVIIILAGCSLSPPKTQNLADRRVTPPAPPPQQDVRSGKDASSESKSNNNVRTINERMTPPEMVSFISKLLPDHVSDKSGWAQDIYSGFTALNLDPTKKNICSVVAIVDQESSFSTNPKVPNLPAIAFQEIERRRIKVGIPNWVVQKSLDLKSSDGRTYRRRIQMARTEGELSDTFEDMLDKIPLGHALLGKYNPIRTAGPMQVSITFAEEQYATRPYPYPTQGSIRKEAFTRRGGLYFGIAHLLDYEVPYSAPIYRFADFNAGRYASRDAAFQKAVATISRGKIDYDGDLLSYKDGKNDGATGKTLDALRSVSAQLNLTHSEILSDLRLEKTNHFDKTKTFQRTYQLADKMSGRVLPREVLPEIALRGPKIQRKLSTAWFADRVNTRMSSCLARKGI